jgi:hypothetical protein
MVANAPRMVTRRAATPAETVQLVLDKQRPDIYLSVHVLEQIADAVLAQYETVVGVRHMLSRHEWENADLRGHMTTQMTEQLVMGAVREGYIPAALPVEEVCYYDHIRFPGPDLSKEPPPGIPAELAEHGHVPWDHVIVTYTLPVRRPRAQLRKDRGTSDGRG